MSKALDKVANRSYLCELADAAVSVCMAWER